MCNWVGFTNNVCIFYKGCVIWATIAPIDAHDPIIVSSRDESWACYYSVIIMSSIKELRTDVCLHYKGPVACRVQYSLGAVCACATENSILFFARNL